MIKGVMSSSPYINVGSTNYPYVNMSTPSAGLLRYNGSSSCIEVYDGTYWQSINTFQDINLTPFAKEILDWAYSKMQEEKVRESLAKTHPAISIALEHLKQAEEQLQTTIYLTKT